MGCLRNEIIKIAALSRCFIVILQAVANIPPDHHADAFNPDITNATGFVDSVTRFALDGFNKWDSKYFLYVAEHGYKAENTFAFFPLLPTSVSIIASIADSMFPFLSYHTCCIVSAVTINFSLFIGAASTLYDLTVNIYGCHKFAFITSLAFCFNPASIFFSACYAESMYSFCVFNGLKALSSKSDGTNAWFYNNLKSSLYFMLASWTRSNGTINAGFILYTFAGYIVQEWVTRRSISIILFNIFLCLLLCTAILLPFALFNIYAYAKFCVDGNMSETINCSVKPKWCCHNPPSIYNHIQKDNWELGLFAYYKWRKTPNFILAAPTVILCASGIFKYCIIHRNRIIYLELPFAQVTDSKIVDCNNLRYLARSIFCFIVHLCFIVVFSLLFMHVEVTTRMVMSSTPMAYWIAASYLLKDLIKCDAANLTSVKNWEKLNQRSKLIIIYFISYMAIGTILHANFLPWT